MNLDKILAEGERLYLNKYKAELEKEFLGFYAVIDIETEQYVVSENKLKAFELAKEKFGDEKLFFGVHVGELNTSTVNFKDNTKENATLSWAV